MPRIVAIGPPHLLNIDWLTFSADTNGVLVGESSLSMRSFSFSGSRGVFNMWHTRRAIASERGCSVVSSTSKSASDLSRVEGVATGCSGSEKESEGSMRLTTSAAPSPSEWPGEATTTWAVQASLAMFRERLCDNPEESSQATCDEVRAHFFERVLRDPSMEGHAANPSRIVLAITNAFLCMVADINSIEFSMEERMETNLAVLDELNVTKR